MLVRVVLNVTSKSILHLSAINNTPYWWKTNSYRTPSNLSHTYSAYRSRLYTVISSLAHSNAHKRTHIQTSTPVKCRRLFICLLLTTKNSHSFLYACTRFNVYSVHNGKCHLDKIFDYSTHRMSEIAIRNSTHKHTSELEFICVNHMFLTNSLNG